MSYVNEAYKNYIKGNYSEALRLYKEAAQLCGENIFYANITLCMKRASIDSQVPQDTVRRSKEVKIIRASPYFDANWYLSRYPDVRWMGMDPAEHYLIYGARLQRDPSADFSTNFYVNTHPGGWQKSMNPLIHLHLKNGGTMTPERRLVLWAANNLAKDCDHNNSVTYAGRHLPYDLAYTASILRANAAIAEGSETNWLAHLNEYLANFDLMPIQLKSGDSLLDRLTTNALHPITTGPLVSVIMPAWNAEKTIYAAACSILNQTWKNLELLIVDDASEDGTWAALQKLADSDSRVRVRRNSVNAGPYVAKNLALMDAKGVWITGHDADDWAHPQRLEQHLKTAIQSGARASLAYMVRMQTDGTFNHIGKLTSFSLDGVARKASISCLFEHALLKNTLGFWDCVRFGADSEMIARAENALQEEFQIFPQIGMICLDHKDSLTNHAQHGVHKVQGVSPTRLKYRQAWSAWHKEQMNPGNVFLPFPEDVPRYCAPKQMRVERKDIEMNICAGKN